MGSWTGNGVKREQIGVSAEEFHLAMDMLDRFSDTQKRQSVAILLSSLGASGCEVDHTSEEGIGITLKR